MLSGVPVMWQSVNTREQRDLTFDSNSSNSMWTRRGFVMSQVYMQVAETFTLDLDDSTQKDLSDIARLDTCVTVVDAAQLMANFDSLEMLHQRSADVAAEDDRAVADLLLEQIEFADVIIINKVSLLYKAPPGVYWAILGSPERVTATLPACRVCQSSYAAGYEQGDNAMLRPASLSCLPISLLVYMNRIGKRL